MTNTYKVSAEFIVAGHKNACSGWKKKLEDKFPSAFINKVKMGDTVSFNQQGGDRYILARVEGKKIAAINMGTGNLYSEAKEVKYTNDISLGELCSILDTSKVSDWYVNGNAIGSGSSVMFDVEESFIKLAFENADSEWKRKIKAEFPEVFKNKYVKFIDDSVIDGQLILSTGMTTVDGVRIGIARGYAPSRDLSDRSICIFGDDVESVQVSKHGDKWHVTVKKK